MSTSKRRAPGEGSITPDVRKNGETWWSIRFWVLEDGELKRKHKRGFRTKKEASAALVDVRTAIKHGSYVSGRPDTVEQYLATWLSGLRLKTATLAYYQKNIRLHVVPHIGRLRLDQVTGQRLSALYRELEKDGRRDRSNLGGALKSRTVRGVHDTVHAAFKAAVHDGLLVSNPADRANPPTAAQTKAPEISPWTDVQVRTFLAWSTRAGDDLRAAWLLLLSTGLRRGELLGLQWADIGQDTSTISVRRAVTSIREAGVPEKVEVGTTKGGSARAIVVGAETMRALASYRAERASISLSLTRANAYVFGSLEGGPHHPDRFSRKFKTRVAACRKAQSGEALRVAAATGAAPDFSDLVPDCRLHDLRHASATLAFQSGVPAKVVQERLGHANVSITLGIYTHVSPTMQKDAADLLDAYLH